MSKWMRAVALLGACIVLAWSQGAGHFPVRSFGFQEGLKDLSVNAFVQDTRGFLWAGTDSGIFFFDGYRFQSQELPATHRYITTLHPDSTGRLWVGTRSGLGVLDATTRRFLSIPELDGPRLNGLGEDATGAIWCLSGQRLFVSSDHQTFKPASGWTGAAEASSIFAHPKAAAVLVAGARSLWTFLPRENRWEGEVLPLQSANEELLLVAMDGEGNTWVRSSRAYYRKGPGAKGWTVLPAFLGGSPPNNLRITRDSEGWVWINTLQGVFRCLGDRIQPVTGGPKGVAPISGLVDREGSPWLVSIGVSQVLGRGLWEIHGLDEGLPSNVIWHMLRDRLQRVWLATDGGLALATPAGWKVVRKGQFSRLRLAPDGFILAVGSPGGTMYRVDPSTLRVEEIRVDVLRTSPDSRGLAVEPDGTVWVSDFRDGVASGRRRQGRWSWEPLKLDGQAPKGVWQIVQDARGTIFLATKGGIYIQEAGGWETIGETLPSSPFSALRTPDGDVWVFYFDEPVLSRHRRVDGKWKRLDEWHPLKGKKGLIILSNALAKDGQIWVGTSQGLGRLNPANRTLEAWYAPGDGIPGADANNHSLVMEPNGDLWYGTTEGVGRFRLSAEQVLPQLPAPILLEWRLAGKPIPVGQGRVELVPGKPIEAVFALNSFCSPGGLGLQARLEGIDQDWMPLEDNHVRYGVLPTGSYRLEVRAFRQPDLPGPPLVLSFRVLPRWWQTWWAVLLGLSALGSLLALVTHLRHRTLRARNQGLQEMVAERTDELRKANIRLEQASTAKSVFLANMSHELRTPLNAILLYSELVAEEAEERGDKSTVADLLKVQSAGKHLLAMINGILDLSKIEAGRMDLELQDEDIGVLLMEMGGALEPLAMQRGNKLVLSLPEEPAFFRTDGTKLRQVLLNLGGNACKFTQNGTITLTAANGDQALTLTVQDTGEGMSQEEVQRVFGAFEQATGDVHRKYGGTGLGLTISRKLIELLGGNLTVDSQPGVGSVFRIHLPRLASEEPTRTRSVSARTGMPSRGTALIIDDDPAMLDVMSRSLAKQGFTVLSARGGVEGLALARRAQPEVITLDIVMDGMSGWEVLGQLKADAATSDIPVVLLTMTDDRAKGFALGAAEFLQKPVRPEVLATVLDRHRRGAPPFRVLTIEDDPSTREALGRMVTRAGWESLEAADAAQALAVLASQVPSVILLDLGLPDMDGFSLVSTLQRHGTWKDIPVIVITGRDMATEDIQKLAVPQVHRVLQKGAYSRDELIALVVSLVKDRAPGSRDPGTRIG